MAVNKKGHDQQHVESIHDALIKPIRQSIGALEAITKECEKIDDAMAAETSSNFQHLFQVHLKRHLERAEDAFFDKALMTQLFPHDAVKFPDIFPSHLADQFSGHPIEAIYQLIKEVRSEI